MTAKRTSNQNQKYADKTISTASLGVSRPLLNSNPMPALKHEKYRNQANQEQSQPFFIMSPSDLLATSSSECLQERCSRHRH